MNMQEGQPIRIIAGAGAGTEGEYVRDATLNEDGSAATIVVRYGVDPNLEHHAGRLIELPVEAVDEVLPEAAEAQDDSKDESE